MNNAVKYIKEVKESILKITENDGGYEIIAENNLDSEIFNHPLTLKIKTTSPVSIIYKNEEQILSPKDDTVLLNIMPNTPVLVKNI